MSKFKEGDVVIVSTGQAGTVWFVTDEVGVWLRNGDIWYGPEYSVRFPVNSKELKKCPIDVDKWNRQK
jgi:hypothetical protein